MFPTLGDQRVYEPDRNDWAGRFGFAYSLTADGSTLLRGGIGTYYDRLYDNLWLNVRNNNFILANPFVVDTPFNYLAGPSQILPLFQNRPIVAIYRDLTDQLDRTPLTLMQPDLRSAYIHSYFFGISQQFGSSWSIEVNTVGSLGRKLITTDLLNRGPNTTVFPLTSVGPISYRANQGTSNYNGLTALTRYQNRFGLMHVAYTLSHSIDNQSEVLRSDYFDLNPTRITTAATRVEFSAFSREFDSSVDRGNSDFDQRHSFIVFSIWDLPGLRKPSSLAPLFRGWRVSQLAAFRSGVPYTVLSTDPLTSPIINNRGNLVNPAALEGPQQEVTGGRRLIPLEAVTLPTVGQLGNTGRNAFRGPGFYNIDLSVSRVFVLPWLGESGRLTFRADAFNFLNHANLTLPVSNMEAPTFGIARYGRSGPESGLPLLSPVNDTARQIQLMLRLDF